MAGRHVSPTLGLAHGPVLGPVLGPALALALCVAPAAAAPVNDWAAFRGAVAACWSVPPDTEGSLIAYRFGLDKAGAIRGTPLVTARRFTGDRAAHRRYEDAASEALARCFPIAVTPAFGAILGESPINLRFVNTPPTAAYQLNNNITIFAPR
ncbi:hypothetical protein Q8W71_19855 [Methylobacterium sp. NEAU 140]|uniref:hypothetical protein n=1 Tax=Methylobacterium sp. NEAU 140 TaxID=3064945 RepID=UPI002734B17F|nr:hypothetical protein [Methylobacterium sp. NEAU 140]MDP4024889.1 hypothetical protein [Methylobacterium sp. NEAU 140]